MERKLRKGFTLTELIIVIVIIGILAGVLIPALSGYVARSKRSAAEQEAAEIYKVYHNYKQEKDAEATSASFAQYYQEVTEKSLPDGVFAIYESAQSITEKGTAYSYWFLYKCSNKYNVYMDQNGSPVLTTKTAPSA